MAAVTDVLVRVLGCTHDGCVERFEQIVEDRGRWHNVHAVVPDEDFLNLTEILYEKLEIEEEAEVENG